MVNACLKYLKLSFKILFISISVVYSELVCSLARFFLSSFGSLVKTVEVSKEPYDSGSFSNENSALMCFSISIIKGLQA